MRVALFIAYAINTPHFETDLELIERHLDENDSVTVLACDGEMASCDVNPGHRREICEKCIGRRRQGMRLLSRDVKRLPFLDLSDSDREEEAGLRTSFDDLADLKRYRIDNLDLGYAALSSFISLYRDTDIDLGKLGPRAEALIRSTWAVYRSIRNFLRTAGVDRFYVFNGRFAPMRAALRACQAEGVACMTHDRGHDLHHFALYPDTTYHDWKYIDRRIRECWAEAGPGSERERKGAEWFENRTAGDGGNWFSYIDRQRDELLPPGWNEEKTNIVVFPSSEDEFVAIGESWNNPLYPSQMEGIRSIIGSLSEDPGDVHLTIRMHPNLAKVDNRETRGFEALEAPFLTVIRPEEPTSTYALMKRADRIVTFGSTAAIEAVFWGTPSILAGIAFSRNLGATYNPASHEELMEMLRRDLPPKDVTPALMYGHYFNTYGIPFRYFRAEGVFEGTFKGKRIGPGRAALLRATFHRKKRRWLKRTRRRLGIGK